MELRNDEYMGTDGKIYCKNCNEVREKKVLNYFGTEETYYSVRCKCLQEEFEREKAVAEAQKRKETIDALYDSCIGVAKFRNYTFAKDDGKTPNETDIAKKYVEKFPKIKDTGQGLLFWGDVGTGKTFLAMCIANALIEQGRRVGLSSFADMVQRAQDFDYAEYNFNNLMQNQLVIIDDVGTERETSFAKENIYEYVDGFYKSSIPMIITTNLSLSEIEDLAKNEKESLYARIFSRILEKCYPVKINACKRRDTKKNINRSIMARLLGVSK